MLSIVTYAGVTPAKKALYCVEPAKTMWDAKHLVATMVQPVSPLTPVLIRDGLQVRFIPPWLNWFFSPSAFTLPGVIYINPALTMVPVELIIHEHVHVYRAQQGAVAYVWSILSGVVVGAVRVLRYGGTIHEWSPREIEAREVAKYICALYAGAPTPLDAAAQVTAMFTGTSLWPTS